MLNGQKLGLVGDHQYTNAGLAVALCRAWLQRTGYRDVTCMQQIVSLAFVINMIRGMVTYGDWPPSDVCGRVLCPTNFSRG